MLTTREHSTKSCYLVTNDNIRAHNINNKISKYPGTFHDERKHSILSWSRDAHSKTGYVFCSLCLIRSSLPKWKLWLPSNIWKSTVAPITGMAYLYWRCTAKIATLMGGGGIARMYCCTTRNFAHHFIHTNFLGSVWSKTLCAACTMGFAILHPLCLELLFSILCSEPKVFKLLFKVETNWWNEHLLWKKKKY